MLDRTLRLCHPVLPYVTEELWRFAGGEGLLMRAPFPVAGEVPRDVEAEAAVEAAIEAVRTLRRLRDDAGLGPRAPLGDRARGRRGRRAPAPRDRPARERSAARTMNGPPRAPRCRSRSATRRCTCAARASPRRCARASLDRLAAARGESERATRKLADERFVSRAPAALVEAEREKAGRFAVEAAELEARLDALGA